MMMVISVRLTLSSYEYTWLPVGIQAGPMIAGCCVHVTSLAAIKHYDQGNGYKEGFV